MDPGSDLSAIRLVFNTKFGLAVTELSTEPNLLVRQLGERLGMPLGPRLVSCIVGGLQIDLPP